MNSITEYPLCIMFCKNFEIEKCNKCVKNKDTDEVAVNYYERLSEETHGTEQ